MTTTIGKTTTTVTTSTTTIATITATTTTTTIHPWTPLRRRRNAVVVSIDEDESVNLHPKTLLAQKMRLDSIKR